MTAAASGTLGRARALRGTMTDAERRLWRLLRDRRLAHVKFRRQVPIGPYVADFLCFGHRLVIEADGGQHAESDKDVVRDVFFQKQGFRILRFWNNDILLNTDGVLAAVLEAMREPPHPRPLSHEGRGEPRGDASSPLAGEGGSRHGRETGEGAAPTSGMRVEG